MDNMENNVSNYQEYTFPNLLGQYDKILVPMIQRDYAQGRKAKKETEVRNNLLNDIFTKESVSLDLVFGSKESRIIDGKETSCFIPIDGQQRLTTLFLLYLYAQRKSDSKLDYLSKFSYDTRRAAYDFCKDVTTKEWSVQEDKKVSDVIKDSSWFMDYWANDPTVEGMLNMLDAIHDKAKVNVFPNNLDKVKFYFFDLESHGLNENLYLKMNSRGKPLTAFENLKAKIEKLLPDNNKIETKWFPENNAAPTNSFKEKWKFFMDRDWTIAFWNKDTPSKYDVNIAKFIVRFLSGYWAAFGQGTDKKTTAKNLEETNRKEQNDKNYADYIQFEPIEKVLKLDDAFPALAYALTIAPTIKPYWSNDSIKVSDKSEYKLLSVIFTYTLFDGDESAMRFAWNMAENYVSEYDNFVKYCECAGKIYMYIHEHNVTFYKSLSDIEFDGNISDQLREEIAKAEQIINGGSEWESTIIEAEKKFFFKGAIRFLFTDGNGRVNWDGDTFKTKWENANEYFDSDGVIDGKEANQKYKSNSLLMKSLLANCADFGKIWWHFELSNDKACWKRILTSNQWKKEVDAIMRKKVTNETTKDCVNNTMVDYIKDIIDDDLLDYVCKEMSGAWIRGTYWNNKCDRYNYHAIWQSGYPASQVVLNPILAQLNVNNKIDYKAENTIKGSRYYKCINRNVEFKYKINDKCYYFQWYGAPDKTELDVYLMDKNWKYKRRPNYEVSKIDKDNYYCFIVDREGNMEKNPSLFTDELERLIKESEEDDKQCEKTE